MPVDPKIFYVLCSSLPKRRQKVPCTSSSAVTSRFECKVSIFNVRLDSYTSHDDGPVGRWKRLINV